jgi:hypothetical protein
MQSMLYWRILGSTFASSKATRCEQLCDLAETKAVETTR